MDSLGDGSGGVGVYAIDKDNDGTTDILTINADYIRTGALEVKKGGKVVLVRI